MTPDHIELYVADREQAVAWYGDWLGFRPMPEHADWVATGPVMMRTAEGGAMLALFLGAPLGAEKPKGWRRLAMGATATEFVAFFRRYQASGQKITGPSDHQKSWSVYFTDPWGNPLEVTTYDYAAVPPLLSA
jgi:catechol 2,3-dioxygenase-like lactoylglutathione lyase family enzyme